MQKYTGNKDAYIYGLFSKDDQKQAEEILELLESNNYKISYDSKSALKKASLVLVFLSNKAVNDKKMLDDISLIFKENKNVLSIFLEEVSLAPGLAMMFGQIQGILKYQLSEEEFKNKLITSPSLNNLTVSSQQTRATRRNTFIFIGVAVAIVLAIVISFTSGMFTKIDENSLLANYGISGNVNSIEKVYIYGTEAKEEYTSSYLLDKIENSEYHYVVVNEEEYDTGDIEDVSDFAILKNLEELCLSGNNVTSIEPLTGLKKLKLLDLTGNHEVNIEGLSKMDSLEVLNMTAIDDINYDELLKMKNLKTLYVSGQYFDEANSIVDGKFEVISSDTIVDNFDEFKKALNDESVNSIYLRGIVEIPQNETVTIRKLVSVEGAGSGYDNFHLTNNGTLIIEGLFGMGLCTRTNNGTIIVKSGGVYTGGMCDSINNGTFIFEKDGNLKIERAHNFYSYGEIINDGNFCLREAAQVHVNGGTFTSTGGIYFKDLMFGGLDLEGCDYNITGKCYIFENGEYKEVSVDTLLANNHYDPKPQ